MSATNAGRLLLALTLAGCLAARAQADGFVLGLKGAPVPEEEQQALVEWRDGREQLFLATRTGPTQGPSVWVVPVPGLPEEVRAEPLERFPRVVTFHSVTASARARLNEVRNWGLVLDSGFLLVFGLLSQTAQATRAGGMEGQPPEGVQVHQRVEKLGLVVELLTAQSAKTLDHYLARHALNARADRLTMLEPYFEQPYTFVCAWSATGSRTPAARSLRIEFPSPTVYYPLRPSQAYGADLAANVYVRGWARPSANPSPAGARCRYGRGMVREEGAASPAAVEPLTRVELGPARDWSADLNLEPGPPTVVRVAQGVEALGSWLIFLLMAAVGVVVASALPWLMVPARQRGWEDWVWAWLVGAATCLSILATAIVFYAWCCDRKPAGRPAPLGRFGRLSLGTVTVSLGTLAVVVGLREIVGLTGASAVLGPIQVLALVVFAIAVPVALVCLVYSAAHEHVIWLVFFAVVHLGAVVGLCEALSAWMGG